MIARYPRRGLATRAQYARTNADLMINEPDGFPSDYPPVWWLGIDSGGGSQPIGPNGPYGYGYGPGLAAVTRATALITGPLTAAPFDVIDATSLGRELPTPRWISDPMLLREDARLGGTITQPAVNRLARSVYWADWIRSACWYGEGPMIYQPDSSGQPLAGTMRLLNPTQLTTEWVDDPATGGSVLVWEIPVDDQATDPIMFDRDGGISLGPIRYQLAVLRNPHSPIDGNGRSSGVFGLNPTSFALARQIQSYASGTFRSGIPAGYLKVTTPDMSNDAATKLKARWLSAHGGDRRSIAVLNATTEFVPLNLSPVDAALVEMTSWAIADIAFAFGLDPTTLGVSLSGSMTYTNVRDAWLNHRDFGLAPWLAVVSDTLSSLTPTGQTVVVDLDGFENPTRQERYAAFKVGIEAGVITVDEAREIEGLPPLPEEPTPEPQPLQLVPAGADVTAPAGGDTIPVGEETQP